MLVGRTRRASNNYCYQPVRKQSEYEHPQALPNLSRWLAVNSKAIFSYVRKGKMGALIIIQRRCKGQNITQQYVTSSCNYLHLMCLSVQLAENVQTTFNFNAVVLILLKWSPFQFILFIFCRGWLTND